MSDPITQAEYRRFQQAYDFFNSTLFGKTLPEVLVTLQRHRHTYGYFSPHRFVGRAKQEATHELAMNPDHFGRSDELILATLVHEMVHVWQEVYGEPSRRSYHNRQWAAKMRDVGLHPSDTGKIGGRETGQSVSHYVIKGGAFDVAFEKLRKKGFKLRWQSSPVNIQGRLQKAASKTKYTCLYCKTNAWAKPGTLLICGMCYRDGEHSVMKAAN